MILTNTTNLPKPIVDIANYCINNHKELDEHEFSVTELLKGTKEIVLSRRHRGELQMDVQDTYNLWSGTAVHMLLERFASSEYMAESRIGINLGEWDKELEGYFLTGSPDLYETTTETLWDYKNTKVAQFDRSSTLADLDWLRQLTIYKLILEKTERTVKHCKIVAMIKDHSAIKARTTEGYPKSPIMIIDYTEAITEDFIKATIDYYCTKVKEVLNALQYSDWAIDPCTPSERFEKTDWAIMKKGNKKAFRAGFSCEAEAQQALSQVANKTGLYIEYRAGEPEKCKTYCTCAPFCSFYHEAVLGERDEGYEPDTDAMRDDIFGGNG